MANLREHPFFDLDGEEHKSMAEHHRPIKRVPLSEDQIRSATVGALRPRSGPIQLVDYDPQWPQIFQREADRVQAALGNYALLIEHVGSTSVPGLAAKPIVDILLVVANSADETAYVPVLESAGFRLRIREPEWYQHCVLKGPESDINLHVFSAGCPEIDRMLSFRDRLRSDESDRRRYELAKRTLAQRDWKYTQNYADAKTAVIEEIIARARETDTV